jgi:hypothetical protein
MPRKRRLIKCRTDQLSIGQMSYLRSGRYFFSFSEEFEDEQHAREAWAMHRDAVTAAELAHSGGGTRPWAFWIYDLNVPLNDVGQPDWAAIGAAGEGHAVLLLEDTSAAEKRFIERGWLEWTRIAVAQSYGARTPAAKEAAARYGVPPDFFDRHAPAIAKRLEAERAEWLASQ